MKNCPICQKELGDNIVECPRCGYKFLELATDNIYAENQQQYAEASEQNQQPNYGDPNAQPYYGGEQGQQPYYGDPNAQPYYGGEQGQQPYYGDPNAQPYYGGEQGQQPYYGDPNAQPYYGGEQGQQPYYGYPNAQPNYGGEQGQQPYYGDPNAQQYYGESEQGGYEQKAPKEKKPIDKAKLIKLAIILGTSLVLVIGLIILLVALLKKDPYKFTEGQIIMNYDKSTDSVFVLSADGKAYNFACDKLRDYDVSEDGTKAILLVDKQGETDVLYYFNGKDFKEIASDVNDYRISMTGSTVIYTLDSDEGAAYCSIYSYNGKSSKKIADAVLANSLVYANDLSAVAYSVDDAGAKTAYYWNGSNHELGRNKYVTDISSKGKYIYYRKTVSDSYSYYVQKGEKEETAQWLGSSISDKRYNEDKTELLFEKDGKYFITVKGGEPQKITMSSNYSLGSMMLPQNAYAVTSIYGKVFKVYSDGGTSLVYLKKSNEMVYLAGNVSGDIYVSDNGKAVFYQKGDKDTVYKINVTNTNAEPIKLTNGEVKGYMMVSDGSRIYYENEDRSLCTATNSSDSKVVAYDVGNVNGGAIFKKNMYYVQDGTLYCVKGGNKASRVSTSGVVGEIYGVQATKKALIMITRESNEWRMYVSTNGSSFKKVYEESDN